jgi:hypothetical protein
MMQHKAPLDGETRRRTIYKRMHAHCTHRTLSTFGLQAFLPLGYRLCLVGEECFVADALGKDLHRKE